MLAVHRRGKDSMPGRQCTFAVWVAHLFHQCLEHNWKMYAQIMLSLHSFSYTPPHTWAKEHKRWFVAQTPKSHRIIQHQNWKVFRKTLGQLIVVWDCYSCFLYKNPPRRYGCDKILVQGDLVVLVQKSGFIHLLIHPATHPSIPRTSVKDGYGPISISFQGRNSEYVKGFALETLEPRAVIPHVNI